MDINYELYKVFFYVAQSLSFFGSQQTSLHFPVCGQPVHQDTGTQTRTAAFYPQYKKSAAHPGRAAAVKTCGTGDESHPPR